MDISKLENTLRSMKSSEFDEILDMRDSQKFDAAWCQVFEVESGDHYWIPGPRKDPK